MPTYEYECRKCGHQFEKYQSILAEPLKTCPKCKGKVARVVSGGGGIIFKGSGFYQTDYKKSSHATTSTDKSNSKKAEGGASDAGKSDVPKKETRKPEKSAK